MSGLQIPGDIFTYSNTSRVFDEELLYLNEYICRTHNVSNIFKKSRKTKIMNARKEFIYRAWELGCTHEQIADFLGFERSTITHHISQGYKK